MTFSLTAGIDLGQSMRYVDYWRFGKNQHRGTTGTPNGSIRNKHIRHQYTGWLKGEKSKQINGSWDLPPRSEFMRNQARIQIQRKRALADACSRHPELANTNFTRKNTRRLYALEKNRLLFCAIPKVGSTNWKKVLMVLEGHHQHVRKITGFEAHHRHSFRDLSKMRPKERDYVLSHYQPKFLYVRHPFVRLISAYRDKIARKKTEQVKTFQIIARHIAFRYRKGPGALKHNLDTGASYNVTWDEWIRYLTNPIEVPSFNEHWREFYKLCLPCKIEYDFIGNLETIREDSSYMLSLFGLDRVSYPTSAKTSSRDLYDRYFGNLSLNALQRLWEIYKLDFELFNYAKPDRLK